MPSAGEELVEVVDDDGSVSRIVTRREMRAANLRHRAVFVVVRAGGRVVVHQRAGWKDVWPSRWAVSFGGVLGVGESWVDAARRELAEEAGIEVRDDELVPLGRGRYEDDSVRVVGEVFSVTSAGPFRFTDDEVVAVDWVDETALADWCRTRTVVPDDVAIVVPMLASPPP
ncbi:MAG TPA: NUDIX domain-containing protein [Acidimicrobiales bacterium]|nr:NUDIX domain-containing protein [Acidimicrobiales bacterium]